MLLLANQLVYFAGDVSFYVRHDLLNLQAFPSISDVFYLTHYPLLVGALWLLVRGHRGETVPHFSTGSS